MGGDLEAEPVVVDRPAAEALAAPGELGMQADGGNEPVAARTQVVQFRPVADVKPGPAHGESWSLFARLGWFAVPVRVDRRPDGSKDIQPLVRWRELADGPRDEGGLERAWAGQKSASGLAVLTGERAGIFAVDADSPEAEERLLRDLPRTPSFRSRRGLKAIFRYPAGERVPHGAGVLGTSLDTISDGGLLVVPPTPGYEWLPSLGPSDVPVAEPPAWIRRAAADREREHRQPVAVTDAPIVEGERNATLARIAGALVRWLGPKDATQVLLATNATRCAPPLPDREVLGIARSVSRYAPQSAVDPPQPLPGEREKPQAERPALAIPELGELLDEILSHIFRFVGFKSRHEPTAVALWSAHCYAVDSASIAAYLRVRSAAEESGKTTLLEVLQQLLRNHAINAVSVSPSVVYRLREKVGPVALLLDESDNALARRQDESARDLLAIVNAGYRRSATVYRTEGRSFEPRAFRAFGPAAIAGIGYLEPTTESRCIPIVLPRKPRGSLERFIGFLVEPAASAIADRLEAWATPDVIEQLRAHRPDYPPELRDRHVEVWWNLFSIADLAGGEWPRRAREAAVALHVGAEDDSTLSSGVLLLSHIRRAFEEEHVDRFATANLLGHLAANEEGPWGKLWGAELKQSGPPLGAASDLARRLRGFDEADGKPIKPCVVRMPDGTTPRGYLRGDFEAAWAAYLGFGSPPATTATTATPLASPVAAVAVVAAPHPNGGCGSLRGEGGHLEGGPPTGSGASDGDEPDLSQSEEEALERLDLTMDEPMDGPDREPVQDGHPSGGGSLRGRATDDPARRNPRAGG